MRLVLLRIIPLAMAFLTTACSTLQSTFLGENEPRNEYEKAQVKIVDSCVLDNSQGAGFLGALLGPIVLPALLNKGFTIISDRLRAAAERANTELLARHNDYFLRASVEDGLFHINPQLQCLIITYGGGGAEMTWTPDEDSPFNGKLGFLNDYGFRFAKEPEFYYEARIVYSSDGEKFSLDSNYLYYAESFSNRSLFNAFGLLGGNSRDFVLTFTFESIENEPFAQGSIPFEALKSPTALDSLALEGKSTGWMSSPKPSPAEQQRLLALCEGDTCFDAEDPDPAEFGCENENVICAQPYSMIAKVASTSDSARLMTELATTVDYVQEIQVPQLEARIASGLPGGLSYDPTDPTFLANRAAAQEACAALMEARADFKSQTTSEGQSTAANLVREKTSKAKTAYQIANLPWWTVIADAAVGCNLTK